MPFHIRNFSSCLLFVYAALSAQAAQPRASHGVDGKATPAITQDYFQPEGTQPPRLLPAAIREAGPSRFPPPIVVGDLTAIINWIVNASQ